MLCRYIPLVAAIGILVGCKKNPEGDSSTTYTIKIRSEQAGDRTEEVESESGTSDTVAKGKNEKEKRDKKVEYHEEIIEMPAGAVKPTKLTRTYKVAQQFDSKTGTMKPLPYEGKTVAIEKKGANYTFTVDGKKLSAQDAGDLTREFSKANAGKIDDFLPKSAVKVGESWTIDPAGVKALGAIPLPIDLARSKITGKLDRVYTKDGKPWGVVSLDCDLAVGSAAGAPGMGSATGTIKMTGGFDTVIDGSSREGTMTLSTKMDAVIKDVRGEMKIAVDMTATKTVQNAK
ncbi:unnamed protein product [Gemmata massiliana]|uniref:Lipoprotein n=1 Tax=Gemmata massiliana TaxID=1210884 RepID=A0A6P2D7I9_9BACT|nr:hypothetical protein [Gemmata massiliana]VTR95462.1 unnamed protein product [Gemmata massiliana]